MVQPIETESGHYLLISKSIIPALDSGASSCLSAFKHLMTRPSLGCTPWH
ncbi:hypothetical protein SBDP1_220043 [Syntrophobacter sp. SbD1]|nr:hypothetical protein SBDP1_220043 [Syntrophobacter sp. SbD1]